MPTEDQVLEALKPVVDPELMLSVVDLGLVYGVNLTDEGKKAVVTMTLTSPMCPVGPQIMTAVRNAAAAVEGVEEAEVELVWEPPWNPAEMATDDVKDVLGIW